MSCLRAERGADHTWPQPASSCLGMGMSLPGTPRSVQAFWNAMAPVWLKNVTMKRISVSTEVSP